MKIRKARPRSYLSFAELGRSGLNHWAGDIKEEFLPELKGKEGRKIYREMMDNSPIIGACLFAVSMLIRQAKPHIVPFKEEAVHTQRAEFVQSCFDDMSETWADTSSEILTMLPFGWAWHETVYKRRSGASRDPSRNSRFSDGLIGWRKLPLRAQESLKKWDLDPAGGIQGMFQSIKGEKDRYIPIEKSLLFRTTHHKNNPEGRSVLRNIYRPWYFCKRIEEIEGIGIERDLAGLPVITGPEGFDLWNADDPVAKTALEEAMTIVKSIRRDEQEGVVLPNGWEIALLASAGKRNFDTTQVINRYNNLMAMVMLADFIILGHNNRYGSFALSSSKTHMFSIALGGWLDAIAGVFNRYAIPRLFQINGFPLDEVPKLKFDDIELPDLAELGTYIANLAKAGFQLFPNIPIEKTLLQAASLPTEGVELGREQPEPEVPDGGAPNADQSARKPRTPSAPARKDSRRNTFRISRASTAHRRRLRYPTSDRLRKDDSGNHHA